jgi:hypothetical protein
MTTEPDQVALPRGVTDAQVARLVDQLRRIPDRARDFALSAGEAHRRYSVSPALLNLLHERGLPAAGGARYDEMDVRNVAMHLAASPGDRAMRRFWGTGLQPLPDRGPRRFEIVFHVRCPEAGHPGACQYRVHLPHDRSGDRLVEPAVEELARERVAIDSDWPELPPEVCELLDELRGVEFMRLPKALRYDLDFVRRAALSDCYGTTAVLVAEGRRRGLTMRSSFGLFVVPPFSTQHNWAEVLVDGRWVPVDPVFITSMLRWGVLEPGSWHPARSPGAIMCRLTDRKVAVARHNGTPAPVTFWTRLLADPA